MRLSASSFDEYCGTALSAAWATCAASAALPTGLGQGLYAVLGYEAGEVWSPEARALLRQDGSAGFLANTPIGLVTFGRLRRRRRPPQSLRHPRPLVLMNFRGSVPWKSFDGRVVTRYAIRMIKSFRHAASRDSSPPEAKLEFSPPTQLQHFRFRSLQKPESRVAFSDRGPRTGLGPWVEVKGHLVCRRDVRYVNRKL